MAVKMRAWVCLLSLDAFLLCERVASAFEVRNLLAEEEVLIIFVGLKRQKSRGARCQKSWFSLADRNFAFRGTASAFLNLPCHLLGREELPVS